MRILVITPIGYGSARSGGAEVYVFELVRRIASKTNIEITILTSNGNIQLTEFQGQKLRIESISQNTFLYPLSLIFSMRRYIRDVDIVVENISKFPLIIPAVVSKVLKKPFVAIVHHIHGETLFIELHTVLGFLFFLYEYVSLFIYALLGVPIVTVSNASKRELMRLGFKDIHVVHPGLAHQSRSSDGVSHKSCRPLLVYVNRVRKYKRLDHFVKACGNIVKEVPDAICLIAGKGDEKLKDRLERLASKLGVDSHVKIYVGEISNNLRYKILRKAWLYVFTSAKEGFGIGVIEALSQGVPVVAYDIPAMRELLSKCRSGVLAKNGDIKDLAEKCIKILKDKQAISTMSGIAKSFVRLYSYDVSAIRFLNAIKTFLKISKERTRSARRVHDGN